MSSPDLVARVGSVLSATDARSSGVLVAWSGGLDSTVLLDLIRRWARAASADFAAVHVDHGLRPSSRRDAAFCRRQAHEWGVPLVETRLEIRRRGSMQESARLQRYAAIARVAADLALGVVVTAHHADDVLETALLNFRRGTSSGGLASLLQSDPAPIPSWPTLTLARPLNRVSKAELRAYAEDRGIAWRDDPTNAKSKYERNRLRHEVLPALSDRGDHRRGMLRTLENLGQEHEALDHTARELLSAAALAPLDHESVALRRSQLAGQPPALVAMALQQVVEALPAPVGWNRAHLQTAQQAIDDVDAVERIAIPGGLLTVEGDLVLVEVARGRGGTYLFERRALPMQLDLSTPSGELPWFGTTIRWTPIDEPARAGAPWVGVAPSAIDGSARLRAAQPGDRLDAAGMSGHKSVSDLLSEGGIPACLRWRWPLLVDESDEILWVPGLRRSAKLDALDEASVRLAWECEPNHALGAALPSQEPMSGDITEML